MTSRQHLSHRSGPGVLAVVLLGLSLLGLAMQDGTEALEEVAPFEHREPLSDLEGPVPAPRPATADSSPHDTVYPVKVRVPQIGVDADIIDLGLTAEGTLEVPEGFGVTGWYTGRSVPGETGPSVVVGHVDSHAGPAVFFHLRDLDTGSLIKIERSDGLVAWFRVTGVELVDKGDFPTDDVYGGTAEPALRLITCGGDFDRSVRSYEDNLIVFAEHLGNLPAASRAVVG